MEVWRAHILMLFLLTIDVSFGRLPWQVFLKYKGHNNETYNCVGYVVSKHLILTTPTCNFRADKVEVYTECETSKQRTSIANSVRILSKRNKGEKTGSSNVGILVVSEGLQLNEHLKPIELAIKCPKKNDKIRYIKTQCCHQNVKAKTSFVRTVYEHEPTHSEFSIYSLFLKLGECDKQRFGGVAIKNKYGHLVGIISITNDHETKITCVSKSSKDIREVTERIKKLEITTRPKPAKIDNNLKNSEPASAASTLRKKPTLLSTATGNSSSAATPTSGAYVAAPHMRPNVAKLQTYQKSLKNSINHKPSTTMTTKALSTKSATFVNPILKPVTKEKLTQASSNINIFEQQSLDLKKNPTILRHKPLSHKTSSSISHKGDPSSALLTPNNTTKHITSPSNPKTRPKKSSTFLQPVTRENSSISIPKIKTTKQQLLDLGKNSSNLSRTTFNISTAASNASSATTTLSDRAFSNISHKGSKVFALRALNNTAKHSNLPSIILNTKTLPKKSVGIMDTILKPVTRQNLSTKTPTRKSPIINNTIPIPLTDKNKILFSTPATDETPNQQATLSHLSRATITPSHATSFNISGNDIRTSNISSNATTLPQTRLNNSIQRSTLHSTILTTITHPQNSDTFVNRYPKSVNREKLSFFAIPTSEEVTLVSTIAPSATSNISTAESTTPSSISYIDRLPRPLRTAYIQMNSKIIQPPQKTLNDPFKDKISKSVNREKLSLFEMPTSEEVTLVSTIAPSATRNISTAKSTTSSSISFIDRMPRPPRIAYIQMNGKIIQPPQKTLHGPIKDKISKSVNREKLSLFEMPTSEEVTLVSTIAPSATRNISTAESTTSSSISFIDRMPRPLRTAYIQMNSKIIQPPQKTLKDPIKEILLFTEMFKKMLHILSNLYKGLKPPKTSTTQSSSTEMTQYLTTKGKPACLKTMGRLLLLADPGIEEIIMCLSEDSQRYENVRNTERINKLPSNLESQGRSDPKETLPWYSEAFIDTSKNLGLVKRANKVPSNLATEKKSETLSLFPMAFMDDSEETLPSQNDPNEKF